MSTKDLLVLNSGSSSIKWAIYRATEDLELIQYGRVEGIGTGQGRFLARSNQGEVREEREEPFPDHMVSLRSILQWVDQTQASPLSGIGHRVVHCGRRFVVPLCVDKDMIIELRRLLALDPVHMPFEIQAMEILREIHPDLPQIACFDTAFHRTIPEHARLYALPSRWTDAGIERFGFHGLSYEYLLEELRRIDADQADRGRLILAHLGSGASMAAVKDGLCVDTTMGLTPLAGLVMSTRTGDMDPAVILHLMSEHNLSIGEVRNLLFHESGLLGVSGISADIRDLLDCRSETTSANKAVTLFCHSAKRHLAALTASLGGLTTLIFTAGIGENQPVIRQEICEGLEYLGIKIDPERNHANQPIISSPGSFVTVRVMITDEERMIAKHTARILKT